MAFMGVTLLMLVNIVISQHHIALIWGNKEVKKTNPEIKKVKKDIMIPNNDKNIPQLRVFFVCMALNIL